MANNYYQQPQFYQPQNIYQQLGAPQPQQQGGPQIQQRLALVQTQHQQQNPSLVQQQLQKLQQQPAQSVYAFQQQTARPGQLQIQQRPQTVHPIGHQLVQYQAQPPAPQQAQAPTARYTYPDRVQQTPFASWVGPQQPGAIPPPQSQRRPLPQPRPGSTSPTRSRPLPAPTPGPSSRNSDASIANKLPTWSQPPSPTKSSTSSLESPKRGRASPPKFSVAPISISNFGTSNYSSPSSPSSVSSLSADSFSASPVRISPVRAAADPTSINSRAESQTGTGTFASSSLSRLKSEFSGIEPRTVPKALIPGGKVPPAWKRTLPDVLPPLLPTPPPNSVEQQADLYHQQQQPPDSPRRSQHKKIELFGQQPAQPQPQRQTQHPTQVALPPPIPSHSKPKPKHTSTVTRLQWTRQTDQTVGEKEADESEEDEDDGDEEEHEEGDDEQYSSDSEAESISSNGKAPPSPNYGILDLPSRKLASTAFPHPGSMPQPPAMVGSGGPRSITSSSASGSGFGSRSGFQTGWSKQEVNTQSMTMRLAASGSDSGSESAISLPRPPMIGMGGSNHSTPTKRSHNVNLDDTPPRRSTFISKGTQRTGSSSAQSSPSHVPQTPGKRALPMPDGQSQTTPTQSSQRRPQSQILNSTTPRQRPPAMSTRPQSQVYQMPLKQVDGSGNGSQGLQRSRSFGRGRELPKTPGKVQQQQSREPRPQPQQPQHPQRSQSQPRSRQEFSPTVSNISIESPAPRGGRDRRADIERMESESDGESERGHEKGTVVHSPVPVPLINIHPEGEEEEAPRINTQCAGFPQTNVHRVPQISVQEVPQINVQGVPQINVQEVPQINIQGVPQINVQDVPRFNVSDVPQINARDIGQKPQQGSKVKVYEVPGISVSGPGGGPEPMYSSSSGSGSQVVTHRGGLRCGGCGEGIVGRIVNAMKQRWHPGCFRCTVCGELLEHVSSYEWEGKAYCHLDYHENFAPKCYSCKTPIYEERFISLDDPALGKRAYHEQHFFCAECGDPFLAPSIDHPSIRTGAFFLFQ
ncbi:hypothetical protein C0992_002663 [Termitomyces sp. T32_za158]|nr:hypothetical protein C0992_002663 [Termitomyces sp. T32_za158]